MITSRPKSTKANAPKGKKGGFRLFQAAAKNLSITTMVRTLRGTVVCCILFLIPWSFLPEGPIGQMNNGQIGLYHIVAMVLMTGVLVTVVLKAFPLPTPKKDRVPLSSSKLKEVKLFERLKAGLLAILAGMGLTKVAMSIFPKDLDIAFLLGGIVLVGAFVILDPIFTSLPNAGKPLAQIRASLSALFNK